MNTLRLWCALVLLSVTSAVIMAQDFTARGTIKDSAGEPLPGASVIIKGTTKLPAQPPGPDAARTECRTGGSCSSH